MSLSPVLIPILLPGARGGLQVKFQGTANATVSTTSVSIANVPIGQPALDRYVIIGINSINNTTGTPLSAVVIGGVAASIAVQGVTSSDFSSGVAAIAIALVPNGSSVTVTWTLASASNANAVSVWTATKLQSPTATSTATVGSGSPMSATLASVLGGGFVAGCDLANRSGVTFTWSGLNSDGSFGAGAVPFTAAHAVFPSAQINLPVSITQSDATAGSAAFAAFR